MRVGIGQINTSAGDVRGNLERILHTIEEARSAGCNLVTFPEYAVPGAFPLDLLRQPEFIRACHEANDEIRAHSDGLAVVVGSVVQDRAGGTALSNSGLFFHDGSSALHAGKSALRSWPIDETGWFEAGPGSAVASLGPSSFGLFVGGPGDLLEAETDVYAGLGAEWLLLISAARFRSGARQEEIRMAKEMACSSGVGLIVTNGVGGADGIVLDGGSYVISRAGELLFEAPRFEDGLYVTELAGPSLAPVGEHRIGAMRSAIELGIRDYVRKSGHDKVVVGISGGVDSALVAALAVSALGPEPVYGVYLPCEHSSESSRRDAHELAKQLQIQLDEISAIPVHESLRSALPFSPEGIVDENLQARARAVLWMAIANHQHALVLTTGNKSEAAVGYSTLYGDTTGALAPIADLYKADVFQMARTFGSLIPAEILEKPPSAELRPGQRDQDDLPPYDELDRILEARIERGASREDLLQDHAAHVVDDILGRMARSEFKRRQVPPAILLTDHPLSRTQLPLSGNPAGRF